MLRVLPVTWPPSWPDVTRSPPGTRGRSCARELGLDRPLAVQYADWLTEPAARRPRALSMPSPANRSA
ncbi:MAG: hypothetical protein ACLUUF_06385 [Bifidobacterium pullorum]